MFLIRVEFDVVLYFHLTAYEGFVAMIMLFLARIAVIDAHGNLGRDRCSYINLLLKL